MKRIFRRGRYANVTSTLALVLALGGTGAYAANTIRSTDIRNGAVRNADLARDAVTSSKVRNGSLRARDFGVGQLPRGATGPQGPAGATGAPGAPGAPGATGPRGPSDAFHVGNPEAFGSAPPLTKSVPAGTYVVTGKVVASQADIANQQTRCDVSGGGEVGSAFGSIGNVSHTQETMVVTVVATLDAPGDLTLVCSGTGVAFSQANLVAIQVASAS